MTETKETLKSLLKAEDKNRVEENRLRNLLKVHVNRYMLLYIDTDYYIA